MKDTILAIIGELVGEPVEDMPAQVHGPDLFELANGLYCWTRDNHGGQGSPGYRAMSRLLDEVAYAPACGSSEVKTQDERFLYAYLAGEVA